MFYVYLFTNNIIFCIFELQKIDLQRKIRAFPITFKDLERLFSFGNGTVKVCPGQMVCL